MEEGAEQTKLEHRYVLWVTQVSKKFNTGSSDPKGHNNWQDEVKPIAKFETVSPFSNFIDRRVLADIPVREAPSRPERRF